MIAASGKSEFRKLGNRSKGLPDPIHVVRSQWSRSRSSHASPFTFWGVIPQFAMDLVRGRLSRIALIMQRPPLKALLEVRIMS